MLLLKTKGHKVNLAPFNFFLLFEPSIYHNFPPILFISLRKLPVQVVTRRAVTGSTHPSGHLTARIIMGRRATNCNHTLSCSQPWRGATKSKPRPWHHHYYHDSDQHTYTLYIVLHHIGYKTESRSHGSEEVNERQSYNNKIQTQLLALSLSPLLSLQPMRLDNGMEVSFECSNLHACLKRQRWYWRIKQKGESEKESKRHKTKVTSHENGQLTVGCAQWSRCKIIIQQS